MACITKKNGKKGLFQINSLKTNIRTKKNNKKKGKKTFYIYLKRVQTFWSKYTYIQDSYFISIDGSCMYVCSHFPKPPKVPGS